MKSRITIELDFDNNNLPVIQVLHQISDDVRDKMVASFLQSLQHTSRWCKIIFIDNASGNDHSPVYRWNIIPISPKEIGEEIRLIGSILNSEYLKNFEIINKPTDLKHG